MKLYKVIDPKTGGDCFGGLIPENHSALITAIPIRGCKSYHDLGWYESGHYTFHVSGSGGPYRVIRVVGNGEDDE